MVNIPAAVARENLGSDEACLVETGSESTSEVIQVFKVKEEVPEDRKSLLDEVQLDSMTESEDNRSRIMNNALLSER